MTDAPPGWERPKISDSALDHIGCSPLIRINKISQHLECEVLAKCEFFNAGGSVKDRIGKRMVEEAERSGRIRPGDTLIEPTSGNTGVGLALAAVVKGYKVVITLPEKMSNEKVNMLKALGAEIVRTPTEAAWDAPDSHIGVAKRLQKEIPNSHILDQYKNRANPEAHYEGTAEEILYQCDGEVDMVVVGAGTGGTITGIAKKLKERLPHVKVVGVDPVGSILAQPASLNVDGPSYLVEGIGYDFIPDVLDRSLVDRWIKTDDAASLRMARRLLREEGLLCGGSSGAAMAGAMAAAKTLARGQRCVVVLPDSTRNYMSKFLDDEWMVQHGFESEAILRQGPLSGPVSHEWWESRNVMELELPTPMTVAPTITCADAIAIMNKHGFDQLPVVDNAAGGHVVGVVTMGNISAKLLSRRVDPSSAVRHVMFTQFRQVPPNTPLSHLSHLFKKDSFCLVVASQRSCTAVPGLSDFELSEKRVVVGVCSPIDLLRFVVSHEQSKSKPMATARKKPSAIRPPAPPPKTADELAVRSPSLGCQEYIWGFVNKKAPLTPEPSPCAVSELGVDGLPTMDALPAPYSGGDCQNYIWGFVKNKTPIGSPISSPVTAATPGDSQMPQLPTRI